MDIMPAKKLNRRDLAAALLAPGLTPGLAHAQAPPATGELEAAREQVRASAKLLAEYSLPMAAEPAFSFKA